MATFRTTAELMAALRSGLQRGVLPGLLTTITAAAKGALVADLATVLPHAGPPFKAATTEFPPPGTALIAADFVAAADITKVTDEEAGVVLSSAEAAIYKEAFRRICHGRFGTKAGLLRMLAEAGID